MVGALIINVMFNLTRIAEKHNQDDLADGKASSKRLGLIFAISLPVLFGLLYAGDYLTAKTKERMLIASAKSVIEKNVEKSDQLVNYSFDRKWIIQTNDILDFYSKIDKNLPYVSIIVVYSLDLAKVFLGFDNSRNYHSDSTIVPKKTTYIRQTTKEERDYLTNVFFNNSDDIRFSANDGRYELFYPYSKNNKKIVLYFSEYQRFGKIGS